MEVHNRMMHLFRGKCVYFLFIALKRLKAFCKKVGVGFGWGVKSLLL